MGANAYKNLLLSESYHFTFQQYERILKEPKLKYWHFIFITAANAKQAAIFQAQIDRRREAGRLPQQTQILILPDEEGERVGSGGATFGVLNYIAENFGFTNFFNQYNCLLLHSGGDSRRIPQYAICGKLFLPVPRNGAGTVRRTLFDEILGMTACIPSKMNGGLMVLTGDVLLLCNPLQIALGAEDVVALTAKAAAVSGEKHGVFIKGQDGFITDFLHKQKKEVLTENGALDDDGDVDIDTGAIFLGSRVLSALYHLIAPEGSDCKQAYQQFVDSQVGLNFYGDFIYPMVRQAALPLYLNMPSEATNSKKLRLCRESIFRVLHPFRIRAVSLSPAIFLHFGSNDELLRFYTYQMGDYASLGWRRCLNTNREAEHYAANNTFIAESARVGRGCYLEDCVLENGAVIGRDCMLSHIELRDITIPDHTILHGVRLDNGLYTVRAYHAGEDTKSLDWDKAQFPVRESYTQAAQDALPLLQGQLPAGDCISMRQCLQHADIEDVVSHSAQITDRVRASLFFSCVRRQVPLSQLGECLGDIELTRRQSELVEELAVSHDILTQMRAHYYLSKHAPDELRLRFENCCFSMTQLMIMESMRPQGEEPLRICADTATKHLPLRVNWGGGWSDTPPYCIAHGGTVLNAAIRLNGRFPVEVKVTRLAEPILCFTSADMGIHTKITSLEMALDCTDPLDDFALHKAALAAFGVLERDAQESLEERLRQLGGGIHLSTAAYGVPRGSGLGTSSILLAACMQAFCQFFNRNYSESECVNLVLRAEQIMNTGGGWQDQAGALYDGIKLIRSKRGLPQGLQVKELQLCQETWEELSNRFCLVYTGQQRLARMILRDVMGKYLACEEKYLQAFQEIQALAVQMAQALEQGDIDMFYLLFDKHREN